ncbi:hypothetical protein ACSSS7_004498 [Eimeria intestinalis]
MEEGYDFEYESDGDAWGGEEETAAVPLLEEVLQREAEAAQKPWTFKCLLSLCLCFLRGAIHLLLLLCITCCCCCCCCCCCSGNCARAASEYRRLLSLLPSVAAGEAAAALEAVFLPAFKLAGLKQYDGIPDVFAASPPRSQQQQKQGLTAAQGSETTPPPLSSHSEEGGGGAPCAPPRGSPSLSSAPGTEIPGGATAAIRASKNEGSIFLEELMLTTLDALGSQGLKRLRVQACSKLLRLYMQLGDWKKARGLLPELQEAHKDPALPPHQQLEAAATEVLCCSVTHDWQQLQQLLPHALRLASAPLDPKSAAAIRECAARLLVELHIHPDQQQHRLMQRHEQQTWGEIHGHLMAAFRHHQEIGDVRAARASLRRAVLIAPLAGCVVDPFSTREGKALQGDADVLSSKALRAAFEANDVAGVEVVSPTRLDPPILNSETLDSQNTPHTLASHIQGKCREIELNGSLLTLQSDMVPSIILLLFLRVLAGGFHKRNRKSIVAVCVQHLERLFVTDPFATCCGDSLLQAVRLKRLQAICFCYSAFPLERLQQTLRLSDKDTTRLLLQVLLLLLLLPLAAAAALAFCGFAAERCCTLTFAPRGFTAASTKACVLHPLFCWADLPEEMKVLTPS